MRRVLAVLLLAIGVALFSAVAVRSGVSAGGTSCQPGEAQYGTCGAEHIPVQTCAWRIERDSFGIGIHLSGADESFVDTPDTFPSGQHYSVAGGDAVFTPSGHAYVRCTGPLLQGLPSTDVTGSGPCQLGRGGTLVGYFARVYDGFGRVTVNASTGDVTVTCHLTFSRTNPGPPGPTP